MAKLKPGDEEIATTLREEPLSEAEIDALRASGQGFETKSEGRGEDVAGASGRKAPEPAEQVGEALGRKERERLIRAERELGGVSRRAMGNEQAADHRRLRAREGEPGEARASTGDESRLEQLRAQGKGETLPQRTQQEEDFGERGRRPFIEEPE